jgi:hypothetical protein
MSEEQEKLDLPEGFQRAEAGDVFKFEHSGQFIRGIFLGWEESKMYPDSYVLKFRDHHDQKNKVVFVNNIVIDKITANKDKIEEGKSEIMVTFLGLKNTKDGKYQYKDYDVAFK